jgi:hypothetical protein
LRPRPFDRGLGALLPQRSPWYLFNQARSRGSHPSELDLTEIAATSRRSLPSCDWLTRHRSRDTGMPSISARQASLQGLPPSAGWDCRLDFSVAWATLALLGVHPSWGFPFPSLGPQRPREHPLSGCRSTPPPPSHAPHDADALAASVLLSALQEKIPKDPSPCAPECQRAGKLVCLLRGIRPLQGSCPLPTRRQVSDRAA